MSIAQQVVVLSMLTRLADFSSRTTSVAVFLTGADRCKSVPGDANARHTQTQSTAKLDTCRRVIRQDDSAGLPTSARICFARCYDKPGRRSAGRLLWPESGVLPCQLALPGSSGRPPPR